MSPPIPPCRCGAPKSEAWHLVCAPCWSRIPKPLQDECYAALSARRESQPATIQRHWAAMRACFKVLGPIEQARVKRLLAVPITEGPKLAPRLQ